ncbi:hypothetical protein [Novosphingobium sp. 17-62-19]|uniref:hypothetical protein n=1 Tax=Novosphingobium sp. 17-62-19 TaxID=1970406 RepID=UPI0025CBA551|nr:hypothetical protein [Novosphingobium sp. 17-62-19]
MSEMSEIIADGPQISDPERAAVMVMLLEDDQAAHILSQLEPAELRLLGEKMCALGEIGPVAIAQAIAGFVEKTERLGLIAHDRVGQVRSLMTRAVGEVKADSLMQRIAPDDPSQTPTIELARWLTPQVIVPLIRDEHPQAIAVLHGWPARSGRHHQRLGPHGRKARHARNRQGGPPVGQGHRERDVQVRTPLRAG